ncbi:MAG TPA: heparan-alpha-glucosaminide N-acetyltransferase domain-containing protein, partial [Enteractinococcus sp.]
MRRLDAPGRITGLDTARGLAIFGMIATHLYPLFLYPLLTTNSHDAVTPSWVGLSLTGVSSALFVVLAGVGLSLLTRNSTNLGGSRVMLAIRAVVLIFIGLLLGHAGSNVAIILVHYGVMFLLAMWFIGLSRKALTITAISWLILAPWLHGVFTRFMHVQAGGTATYVEQWRLWTSPTLMDVLAQPLLTVWDIFFTGYYPVISFFGYVLIGMAIGRANLSKLSTGLSLLLTGAGMYMAGRGLAAWFLSDQAFAYRIAYATGTPLEELDAVAATGAQINTDLVM